MKCPVQPTPQVSFTSPASSRVDFVKLCPAFECEIAERVCVLLQGYGFDLLDGHIGLAISCDQSLYEGLGSFEHIARCEQSDSVHERVHGDNFIDVLKALRKRLRVATRSLTYEFRIKLLALRNLSIRQLSLCCASLDYEITEN